MLVNVNFVYPERVDKSVVDLAIEQQDFLQEQLDWAKRRKDSYDFGEVCLNDFDSYILLLERRLNEVRSILNRLIPN